MTNPMIYKDIVVQHVFLVSKDGTLQITPVSDVPKKMKFKNEREAREYVQNYKVQL